MDQLGLINFMLGPHHGITDQAIHRNIREFVAQDSSDSFGKAGKSKLYYRVKYRSEWVYCLSDEDSAINYPPCTDKWYSSNKVVKTELKFVPRHAADRNSEYTIDNDNNNDDNDNDSDPSNKRPAVDEQEDPPTNKKLKSKEIQDQTFFDTPEQSIHKERGVKKFARRARRYILTYYYLETNCENEEYKILSLDNIEKMKEKFKTHRCAFDFDRKFIDLEVTSGAGAMEVDG